MDFQERRGKQRRAAYHSCLTAHYMQQLAAESYREMKRREQS